jgi:hypothetical protein
MNCKQQFKASEYSDWTAKKLEFKKWILYSPNVKPEKGKWNSETVLRAWENQQEQAGACEGTKYNDVCIGSTSKDVQFQQGVTNTILRNC